MLHPTEITADSTDNITSEICTEWHEIYSNCQVKSTAEPTGSDQGPTETSGTSDRTGVTNTPETNTSKGSSDKMALIVGTVVGGIIFVFLLIVIVLTAIVCYKKRHQHKRLNHLIHGPVLECE